MTIHLSVGIVTSPGNLHLTNKHQSLCFKKLVLSQNVLAEQQMMVSTRAVSPSPGSLYLTASKDLFSRSLLISQQGHQHLKNLSSYGVSLKKSRREVWWSRLSANGISTEKFANQQMASPLRSLQLPIKWHLPNTSRWEVWWRTLQIFLSSWDICTQIN